MPRKDSSHPPKHMTPLPNISLNSLLYHTVLHNRVASPAHAKRAFLQLLILPPQGHMSR